MDLLAIWATWIFDSYERVKGSLTYTFHFLFTQPCYGNYFLFSGKQILVSIKGAKICLEGSDYFWKEERLWVVILQAKSNPNGLNKLPEMHYVQLFAQPHQPLAMDTSI